MDGWQEEIRQSSVGEMIRLCQCMNYQASNSDTGKALAAIKDRCEKHKDVIDLMERAANNDEESLAAYIESGGYMKDLAKHLAHKRKANELLQKQLQEAQARFDASDEKKAADKCKQLVNEVDESGVVASAFKVHEALDTFKNNVMKTETMKPVLAKLIQQQRLEFLFKYDERPTKTLDVYYNWTMYEPVHGGEDKDVGTVDGFVTRTTEGATQVEFILAFSPNPYDVGSAYTSLTNIISRVNAGAYFKLCPPSQKEEYDDDDEDVTSHTEKEFVPITLTKENFTYFTEALNSTVAKDIMLPAAMTQRVVIITSEMPSDCPWIMTTARRRMLWCLYDATDAGEQAQRSWTITYNKIRSEIDKYTPRFTVLQQFTQANAQWNLLLLWDTGKNGKATETQAAATPQVAQPVAQQQYINQYAAYGGVQPAVYGYPQQMFYQPQMMYPMY